VLAVADREAVVEAELAAGRLCCPGCETELRPWGWARRRQVRFLGATLTLRLRRSRCPGCGSTHVLVPTCLLLRRADAAEVIGWALLAKLSGAVLHRWVGARLGRPPATVRNWLRRFEKQCEQIRVEATRWAYRLDSSLGRIKPQDCPLGDALEALAQAVRAATALFGPAACPWHVVSALTGTRLLSPG
jgi:hypothetical protein